MEVDREWSRMPKKEEVEQHMRELQRQAEELRDEISLVLWPTTPTWAGCSSCRVACHGYRSSEVF